MGAAQRGFVMLWTKTKYLAEVSDAIFKLCEDCDVALKASPERLTITQDGERGRIWEL
jgi:hypothetical protein